MILECEHCGSHNYKIDYIEGYSGETEVKMYDVRKKKIQGGRCE
jgi:predicted nucleic-acid-binding Zn-ribbon protein